MHPKVHHFYQNRKENPSNLLTTIRVKAFLTELLQIVRKA